MLNRIIYFGYYLKKLDWNKLITFQQFVRMKNEKGIISQWIGVLSNSLRYNISILEYYQFGFFEKKHEEKISWAGTGTMYEYQRIMNPPSDRIILDDKRKFYKNYKEYFVNKVYELNELEKDTMLINELYTFNKLVFKVSNGKCGESVILKTSEIEKDDLIAFMKSNGYDMVETFIQQHPDLDKLSPSAVNTVRIFTQLDRSKNVEILGCRQRISINSSVDNMAEGNAAASINEELGVIEGPGYFSDITKEPIYFHPVTKTQVIGFKVPFWKECVQLAKDAALKHPENRSIGWDIVVTQNGPGLIEGNHDWCKLVWQLPVNRGLKSLLKTHV